MNEKEDYLAEPLSVKEQAFKILIDSGVAPKSTSPDEMDINTSMAIVNLNKIGINSTENTLDYMLKAPELNKAFSKFLEGEFSKENLSCYQDIQKYKSEQDPIAKANLGKVIAATYCVEDAINVDLKTLKDVHEKMAGPNPFNDDLFDIVEKKLQSNLYDSCSRFIHTKPYKDVKVGEGITTNKEKDCLAFLLLDTPQSKEFATTVNKLSKNCDEKLEYAKTLGMEPIEKIEQTLLNYQRQVVDTSYDFLQSPNPDHKEFNQCMARGKNYLTESLPPKLHESVLNSLLQTLTSLIQQIVQLVESVASLAKSDDASKSYKEVKDSLVEQPITEKPDSKPTAEPEQKSMPFLSAPPSTLSSASLSSSAFENTADRKEEPTAPQAAAAEQEIAPTPLAP